MVVQLIPQIVEHNIDRHISCALHQVLAMSCRRYRKPRKAWIMISPIITSDNLPCKSFVLANVSPAAFMELALRPKLHRYVINKSPSNPPHPWKWPGNRSSYPTSSPAREADTKRAMNASTITAMTRRKRRSPPISWRLNSNALSRPLISKPFFRQSL